MSFPLENTPYYAVIFTSVHTQNIEGYIEMAQQMEAFAKIQQGFLGIESARSGLGITVSYWESLAAILKWKQHADHLFAQQKGKSDWYENYQVRICKVERAYSFSKPSPSKP